MFKHGPRVVLTPVHVTLPGGKEQEFLPLDIDVSPFDNSNTKKEGVSYTYKTYLGIADIDDVILNMVG